MPVGGSVSPTIAITRSNTTPSAAVPLAGVACTLLFGMQAPGPLGALDGGIRRSDLVEQDRRVTGEREIGREVGADRRRVSMDMDEALTRRREGIALGRDVRKPRAEHQDEVRVGKRRHLPRWVGQLHRAGEVGMRVIEQILPPERHQHR